MPTTFSGTEIGSFWQEFVDAFGTHVPSQVTMGATFTERSTFERTKFASLISSTTSTDKMAKVSGFGASFGVEHQSQYEKDLATFYQKSTQTRMTYTIGSKISSAGTAKEWFNSTFSNPSPVKAKLTSLATLLTTQHFPNDANITLKQKSLSAFFEYYCTILQKDGIITDCQLQPDTMLPVPSSFGGIYLGCTTTNCKGVSNPYTGAQNCPKGYTSHEVGSYGTSTGGANGWVNNCGWQKDNPWCKLDVPSGMVNIEVCLRDSAQAVADPAKEWGGILSFANPFWAPTNNPLTTSMECTGPDMEAWPLFAWPIYFKSGDYSNGLLTSICFPKTQDAATFFGGTFVSTSGPEKTPPKYHPELVTQRNIVNKFTNALSCPVDYTAYKYPFPSSFIQRNDWQGTNGKPMQCGFDMTATICLNNVPPPEPDGEET
jgi:hypothetical protein